MLKVYCDTKEYTASCTKMSNYLCKKGSYFFYMWDGRRGLEGRIAIRRGLFLPADAAAYLIIFFGNVKIIM